MSRAGRLTSHRVGQKLVYQAISRTVDLDTSGDTSGVASATATTAATTRTQGFTVRTIDQAR